MASSLLFARRWKIARHQLRASVASFSLSVLSIAIGVGAAHGSARFFVIGSVGAAYRAQLHHRAADLSARMFQQPTPEEQKDAAIEAASIQMTPVTELLSMASAGEDAGPVAGLAQGGRSDDVSVFMARCSFSLRAS